MSITLARISFRCALLSPFNLSFSSVVLKRWVPWQVKVSSAPPSGLGEHSEGGGRSALPSLRILGASVGSEAGSNSTRRVATSVTPAQLLAPGVPPLVVFVVDIEVVEREHLDTDDGLICAALTALWMHLSGNGWTVHAVQHSRHSSGGVAAVQIAVACWPSCAPSWSDHRLPCRRQPPSAPQNLQALLACLDTAVREKVHSPSVR
jgi:hypothetical protein